MGKVASPISKLSSSHICALRESAHDFGHESAAKSHLHHKGHKEHKDLQEKYPRLSVFIRGWKTYLHWTRSYVAKQLFIGPLQKAHLNRKEREEIQEKHPRLSVFIRVHPWLKDLFALDSFHLWVKCYNTPIVRFNPD
jgi:hypothetical protein